MMHRTTRRTFLQASGAAAMGAMGVLASQSQAASTSSHKTPYPDIPRIESHAHVGSDPAMIGRYHKLREMMLDSHGADLAMWINLGNKGQVIDDLDSVEKAGQGRLLSCISDYKPHDGLDIPPDSLKHYLDQGFVGYKIWAGPPARRLKEGEAGYPYIDDPVHIPTFNKMEAIGMVAASIHIADPNGPFHERTKWLPDPVAFWKQMMAFKTVVERHPKLVFVAAHAMWSICQDAQIDYLRFMLSTHPNLHIDLAATFQYYNLVSRDNLRDFMIEYSDRILFGTDISRWDDGRTASYVPRYARCFQMLETDDMVEGGFFGGSKTQGLKLPPESLENIYYKNAARIYPRVNVQLKKLGY
ncbi:MAG: amidohydrolase family protein [Phycisphaeraceae bacterium]|nr:amidohydrolase family protein [Phycisphaeraceae bacterium]